MVLLGVAELGVIPSWQGIGLGFKLLFGDFALEFDGHFWFHPAFCGFSLVFVVSALFLWFSARRAAG